MRGAEALIRMLIEYDVNTIFGVPGGQTNPMYEAIHDIKGRISHILFRDETNAVFAADAYAKITNKPGVADATLGPGALRAIPAIAESYNSSIPLIQLVGNNPSNWLPLTVYRGNASQAVDQLRVLEPITKWCGQIINVNSIPSIIRFAFRAATSGRPGPVAIDIPYDILTEEVEFNDRDFYCQKEFSKVPATRIVPSSEKILQASKLIQSAERPLIISGGGVFLSNALNELYKLSTTFGIPVATTINGKGSFPETHPFSVGVLGSLGGWNTAELVVKKSDLLIFVGSNVDQMTTFDWSIPSEEQKVIHIDIDPNELGRSFVCNVAITGDAQTCLSMLNDVLSNDGYKPKMLWVEEINKLKNSSADALDYLDDNLEYEKLNPKMVMKIIDKFLEKKGVNIIVSDASSASGWVAGCIRSVLSGRRFLFPRGMAGLGYAIPASIGSSIAAREIGLEYSKCIAIAGDGGAAYSIAEIETAKRVGTSLICIILNDSSLGWIRKIQEKSGKLISSEFTAVNFARVSEGFGGRGYEVKSYGDLEWALESCYNDNLPSIIDVKVFTMVPYKPLFVYF